MCRSRSRISQEGVLFIFSYLDHTQNYTHFYYLCREPPIDIDPPSYDVSIIASRFLVVGEALIATYVTVMALITPILSYLYKTLVRPNVECCSAI